MKRVLIVDDDPALREALSELLESEGWEATCAANGQEALSALELAPADVILLDYMMPVMNGGEFRVAQRARRDMAAIPVVLISAACDIPEVAAIAPAAVLVKPFAVDALLRCLEESTGAG